MKDIAPGTELAGYRIVSVIGRGGMGVVYLAEHRGLERQVALKVLAPELSSDEGFRARFQRESRLAASLDHPNVIPIYEAGEADGVLFIAMRYVAGPDLRVLCRQVGQFAAHRALGIIAQLASALDAAHARGLIHRDVKPGNVLVAAGVGPEGGEHVYLTDFGLTKLTGSKTGLTLVGQMVGTIDYISPEQINGDPVDGRADIYALGCVLYELLAGQPPYVRDSDLAIMAAHLQEPPPRISRVRPDLPAGLDGVIATALAKLPRERFATASGLPMAARGLLEQADRATQPTSSQTSILPSPQRATYVGPQPAAPPSDPPPVAPRETPPTPPAELPTILAPTAPRAATALTPPPAAWPSLPPVAPPAPIASAVPPRPVPRPRMDLAALLIGAALLLGGGAGWAFFGSPGPSSPPASATIPRATSILPTVVPSGALETITAVGSIGPSRSPFVTPSPTPFVTPSPTPFVPPSPTPSPTPTRSPTPAPAEFDKSLTPDDLTIARSLDPQFVDLESCRHYKTPYTGATSSFRCSVKRIPVDTSGHGGAPPDFVYYDSFPSAADARDGFHAVWENRARSSNPDCTHNIEGHHSYNDTNQTLAGQYACYTTNGSGGTGILVWTEVGRNFVATIVNGGNLSKLDNWWLAYPLLAK